MFFSRPIFQLDSVQTACDLHPTQCPGDLTFLEADDEALSLEEKKRKLRKKIYGRKKYTHTMELLFRVLQRL